MLQRFDFSDQLGSVTNEELHLENAKGPQCILHLGKPWVSWASDCKLNPVANPVFLAEFELKLNIIVEDII